MKTRLLAVVAVVLLGPGMFAADKDEGWTRLFNGKDLTGLEVKFRDADKDADPARTFSVKEGALIVSGKPICYIYTNKSYKDYVLRFDWRFPKIGRAHV